MYFRIDRVIEAANKLFAKIASFSPAEQSSASDKVPAEGFREMRVVKDFVSKLFDIQNKFVERSLHFIDDQLFGKVPPSDGVPTSEQALTSERARVLVPLLGLIAHVEPKSIQERIKKYIKRSNTVIKEELSQYLSRCSRFNEELQPAKALMARSESSLYASNAFY